MTSTYTANHVVGFYISYTYIYIYSYLKYVANNLILSALCAKCRVAVSKWQISQIFPDRWIPNLQSFAVVSEHKNRCCKRFRKFEQRRSLDFEFALLKRRRVQGSRAGEQGSLVE